MAGTSDNAPATDDVLPAAGWGGHWEGTSDEAPVLCGQSGPGAAEGAQEEPP